MLPRLYSLRQREYYLCTLASNATEKVTSSKENVMISFFNRASVVGTGSAASSDLEVSDQDRAAAAAYFSLVPVSFGEHYPLTDCPFLE